MHLSTRHEYPASPSAVAAMLQNPDFLRRVATRAGAIEAEVSVGDAITELSLVLEAPDMISSFVGSTLRLVQSVTWQPAAADGSRRHRVEIAVPGLPVTMYADGVLSPDDAGTVASYEGELIVRIPLLGKKIEQQAAPVVLHALDVQSEVGREWLAEGQSTK